MRGRGAGATALSRPAGLSRGVTSLWLALMITASIALLTGAAAVVILFVVGLVAILAAALTGWRAVRRVTVRSVSTAELAEAGAELVWRVQAEGSTRVHLQLCVDGVMVASGWLAGGTTTLAGTTPSRGVYREVVASWSSSGALGMLWWRRSTTIPITPLAIAPRGAEHGAEALRAGSEELERLATSVLAGRDEMDGVRAWREGDDVAGVHWPSTLRAGELVVHQRRREVDEHWVVQASTGTDDPDAEAARVRTTLDRGLATGAHVSVQLDGGAPTPLADRSAVLWWCAAFEQRPAPAPPAWWRRAIGVSPEPEVRLPVAARWAVAAAAVTPLVMMLEPLGYGIPQLAVVVAMIALGALFSMRGPARRPVVRQVAGVFAALGVAVSLIDLSAITSVVNSLRFLLPQLLVTLVVLQGFECIDRRAARVSLACSAMLTAYAAGIRVDPSLAIWLTAAVTGIAIAWQAISRTDRIADRTTRRSATATAHGQRQRVIGARIIALAGAGAAMLALLAVIPIPEGPAQLTLPSWLDDYRPTPSDGSLVAADGSPLLGGAGNGDRGGSGEGGGGYPGFSPTMDISLRGDLGDAVVLRVRSPYPDFWRGQTFTDFDGRSWTVDADTGRRTDGPDHALAPAFGDVPLGNDDELIQTFYAEMDLPNIVFAATRAKRVLLEAPLWARPDGALRAEVVLPKGSAYTVVSERSGATEQDLRFDGDLSRLEAPPALIALPASTTDRTRALAGELAATAASDSTYDVLLSIQAWLATNVAYNLDAPVPSEGTDAVDDFLFESQQGFCEQIATATAIMLRSLGIPARIATGYVPSERDAVAGVWISRARDAHAWVEVRFPSFGWVAFDPTASVPLAGEATRGTIGGELMTAVGDAITAHLPLLLGLTAGTALAVVGARIATSWWRRRRRGRWGVLQDRFLTAALRRGADANAPNAELAEVFDDTAVAAQLAEQLDRTAFAADWADDDASFARAAADLVSLSRGS